MTAMIRGGDCALAGLAATRAWWHRVAEHFARRLAGLGVSLVLTGRNQSRIDEVVERTRARLAWTLHRAGLGSMTISRRAEVQAGRGAATGAERD